MIAIRDDVFLYIRSSFSAAYDIVERVLVLEGYSFAGTLDVGVTRLITVATAIADTVSAFNSSTNVITVAGDDAPPVWINKVPLAGNHGPPAKRLTATAHGKTNVDVGSQWTDTASKVWVLAKVEDADTLLISEMPGGTATEWTITEVLTGTTLTHSIGATHTSSISFSSIASTFLLPFVQDRVCIVLIDGVEVVGNGSWSCEVPSVSEHYRVPNLRSLIDDLVANVGSSSAPVFNRSSVQSQVEVNATYSWRDGELCSIEYQILNIQDYADGIIGVMQAGPIDREGTDHLFLYAPGMATSTTTGLNLTEVADITSNSLWFTLDPDDMLDPSNPPSRLAQILKTSGGASKYGFVTGYSTLSGRGQAKFRASNTAAGEISGSTNKMYPFGVGERRVRAGQVFDFTAYRGVYDPTSTVNFIYRDGGDRVWVIDIHDELNEEFVPLPFALRNSLLGKRAIEVEKSADLIQNSEIISQKGMCISVPDYGYIITRIGS